MGAVVEEAVVVAVVVVDVTVVVVDGRGDALVFVVV